MLAYKQVSVALKRFTRFVKFGLFVRHQKDDPGLRTLVRRVTVHSLGYFEPLKLESQACKRPSEGGSGHAIASKQLSLAN